MGYRVREHADPQGLLDRAGALLYAREADHTVMLGSLSRLAGLSPEGRPEALLCSVEHDGEVVAAAVRTPPRSLLLSAEAPPGAVEALVAHLDGRDPALDRVNGLAPDAAAFGEALARRRRGGTRTVMELRLFACARVSPPRPQAPGIMREAATSDHPRLVEWFDAFTAEALPHERWGRRTSEVVTEYLASADSGLVLWVDGQPRSMAAYTSFQQASPRLGAVYTPPALRGRGYASALVAALTQRLLDAGHRQVVLFTDLGNPTSNSIYPAVGYRQVADFAEIEIKGADS